jgi:hypothetical protein
VARDLRDAGAGDRSRSNGRRFTKRGDSEGRDHAPARGLRRGACPAARPHRECHGRGGAGPGRAGDIAEHADFFSFGTNDLTQTALGLSRDDAEGTFLAEYLEQGVIAHSPFETLDQDGVGELIRIGVARGRAVKPELKIGICGEHGGDPQSIAFCHEAGLDYVSCSPFRVPLARLAAAQAALAERGARYEAAGG